MQSSKRNYGWYTLIFLGLVGITYGIFLLTGKSFIWEGDGLAQHFPVMEKFYTWLHQGRLAGWSWDLGLGADKLTTFSYYVLGDPFSYLIGLFPRHLIETGYNVLILLRLYVSGLAFLLFARQRGGKSSSQLLGTLSYTFMGYALYVSIRHPFFLLPMILFPLLAYGIDHIYRQKSWLPLAGFTGLALVSNFYFAYILAIGSLVYAVLRYFACRHDYPQRGWRVSGQLVGAGAVGFLLSGVLFLPSLLGVLHSTRATGTFANGYRLYPVNYYLRLPNAFVTTGNPMQFWVNLGLAGLTFLSLIYVLKHFRQYLWLNLALLGLAGGTLLPGVAAIMNGGTTPSQRWLLLGCLAFSLAVMELTSHLAELTRSDLTAMGLGVVGLLVVVWAANGFIFNNSHPHDFVQYGLLLLTLGAVFVGHFYQWSPRRLTSVLGALLSLNVVANGYGYFSPNSGGASQQLLPRGVATKFQRNFYDGAQQYVRAQSGFHRSTTSTYYYYSNDAKTNLGMNLGAHDIMSYFSVQNGAVGDFSEALGNAQFKMNKPINQADSRTTMLNLLGVKYLFARSNQLGTQAFPYGYRPVKRHGKPLTYRDQPVHNLGNNYDTVILKSRYALPLAYLQTHQLTAGQFARLNGSAKEQALTTGAVVTTPLAGVPSVTAQSRQRQVGYRTRVATTTVIDSLGKVVTYRQQGNQMDPTKVTTTNASLMKKNQDRSVNITTDRTRLQRLTTQNKRTITRNNAQNRQSLRAMVSDNQNVPMTYHLKIKQPQATRHTELYLELNGIQAQRFTVADKYQAAKNTHIFRNQAFAGIDRLNQLRSSLWNLSDGAYGVTATAFQNVNGFNQLGQSNLSDYQPKKRVLLNLGYSAKPRRTIKLTFRGVKRLSFKSAKVIAVPFGKAYGQRMRRLQHQGLNHLVVKANTVSGEAAAKRASVLTTSIPYSRGWHLTVDGQTQPTTKVNVGFVGARLAAGRHQVKLTYWTPGLRVGMLATVLGMIVMLAGLGWYWLREQRKR